MPININGNSFYNLKGFPQEAGTIVEMITREGFDGTAMRQMGVRGASFSLISYIDADTPLAGRLIHVADKLLQGIVVDFEMPDGTQFFNGLCEFVELVDFFPVHGMSGGTLSTGVPDVVVVEKFTIRFP